MYTKILVPVDGSENALKALDSAIELQKLKDCEILLLTVFRHHSLLEHSISMVRPEDPQTPDAAMRDYATEVVETAKEHAEKNGAKNVRGFIKRGPPSRTIVEFGKEHGADLIVIGSRGSGDLENYLLGSVSHKVTSLAKCPVLVI